MSEKIEMENDSATNKSKERCATREKVSLDALKAQQSIWEDSYNSVRCPKFYMSPFASKF